MNRKTSSGRKSNKHRLRRKPTHRHNLAHEWRIFAKYLSKIRHEHETMSRSKLRDKFMKSIIKGHSFFASKMDLPVRNPHRQDEMPKNSPSRIVSSHCRANIDWLQNAPTFGGHSRPRGGHRRVSGLVRASLKREERREIESQLGDHSDAEITFIEKDSGTQDDTQEKDLDNE